MKMTLAEALAIPKGMKFEEYGKLIEKKNKLQKTLRNLSIKIQDAEDGMDVLKDEVGSDRYNKHLQNKQKAETKREKALAELNAIIETIGGTL